MNFYKIHLLQIKAILLTDIFSALHRLNNVVIDFFNHKIITKTKNFTSSSVYLTNCESNIFRNTQYIMLRFC